MNNKAFVSSALGLLIMLSSGAAVGEDDWQFTVRVNGWFPDVSGETAFGAPGGDTDFTLDIEDVLGSVEMAALLSLEARKGQWGVLTDVVYSSVGDDGSRVKARPIGRGDGGSLELRLDADLDVDSLVWMGAGFYRLMSTESLTVDLLAGVRYIDIQQDLDWEISASVGEQELPGRGGSAEVEADNWDAIVGVRGRVPLFGSERWFLPFYVDGGAGDSDFTWQAATGLGYAMERWHFGLVWRHLDYDLDSGAALADIQLSGPAAEFEYSW